MSPFALLQVSSLAVFALLLVGAGWQDLRTMRIANGVSLAVVGCFVCWALASLALGTISLAAIAWSVACAAILFAVGALGFAAGVMGGGDVKLLGAGALFAGPDHLLVFLTVTALAGGLLGLAVLAGARLGPAELAPAGAARARLRAGLPYGPAIAAGGLWVAAMLAAPL